MDAICNSGRYRLALRCLLCATFVFVQESTSLLVNAQQIEFLVGAEPEGWDYSHNLTGTDPTWHKSWTVGDNGIYGLNIVKPAGLANGTYVVRVDANAGGNNSEVSLKVYQGGNVLYNGNNASSLNVATPHEFEVTAADQIIINFIVLKSEGGQEAYASIHRVYLAPLGDDQDPDEEPEPEEEYETGPETWPNAVTVTEITDNCGTITYSFTAYRTETAQTEWGGDTWERDGQFVVGRNGGFSAGWVSESTVVFDPVTIQFFKPWNEILPGLPANYGNAPPPTINWNTTPPANQAQKDRAAAIGRAWPGNVGQAAPGQAPNQAAINEVARGINPCPADGDIPVVDPEGYETITEYFDDSGELLPEINYTPPQVVGEIGTDQLSTSLHLPIPGVSPGECTWDFSTDPLAMTWLPAGFGAWIDGVRLVIRGMMLLAIGIFFSQHAMKTCARY